MEQSRLHNQQDGSAKAFVKGGLIGAYLYLRPSHGGYRTRRGRVYVTHMRLPHSLPYLPYLLAEPKLSTTGEPAPVDSNDNETLAQNPGAHFSRIFAPHILRGDECGLGWSVPSGDGWRPAVLPTVLH